MDIINPLGLFCEPEKEEPVIRNSHSQFEDDPRAIRWRAWWDRNYAGDVVGIQLQAYPVVRETAKGVWIDPLAYHSHDGWSQPYKELLRWVSNDGGAAWAKKTKADALESLVIRYDRWAKRIIGDVGYFIEASRTIEKLLPDKAGTGTAGLKLIREYVAHNA